MLTHDAMAEGTHFRSDADKADVAWKLVATNLSDLAAKGAEPMGVLLQHSLSAQDERFLVGLQEVLEEYGVPLLGGDTISGDSVATFGLTAIGRATHTPVPSRSGALVGDAIYVTGELGRAMLGFEGALGHLAAFSRPRPRLKEGQALAPLVSAMMDVSDGLLLDCQRMGIASHVSMQISSEPIPVADAARRQDCIRWGDDYELLFTVPGDISLPVSATQIGTVQGLNTAPLWLDGEVVSEDSTLGYQHGATLNS